jgi:N-acetylglucosaminyldiphosphoundecaprenol N-acetyl-beta-D-mannosaminyltransferase
MKGRKDLRAVEILGVRVSCASREDVLQLPLDWAMGEGKRTIFYVNAHCLNLATREPTYRATLNQADLVYSDGVGVVWASRWLGGCPLEKVTGRDWIHDFSAQAAQSNLRIYLLAGTQEIIEKAQQNLIRQHTELKIVGTRNGYFEEAESDALIEEINQAAPQILLVGMGTPRQEKWLADHRDQIQAPVCWAVGALFDYVAGVEPPVPGWLNRLNLEWLWRLLVDPLGKWRRYLIGNPLFLYRLLRQKMKTK